MEYKSENIILQKIILVWLTAGKTMIPVMESNSTKLIYSYQVLQVLPSIPDLPAALYITGTFSTASYSSIFLDLRFLIWETWLDADQKNNLFSGRSKQNRHIDTSCFLAQDSWSFTFWHYFRSFKIRGGFKSKDLKLWGVALQSGCLLFEFCRFFFVYVFVFLFLNLMQST